MSATVFHFRKYRFFFFSREETRRHVHVRCSDGEAKFWIDPAVELAVNYGLSQKELNELEKVVREQADEIRDRWDEHFRNAGG